MSTVVPGADLARFLAAYPPFDHLDEETRAALAAAARVDAYATGELVLDAFATASVDVYVVVSGRVELWDDRARLGGAPDEVMGPGGLFGFSAMLTERSIGPRAVAAVPSTVARIPETAALPVFTSRQGARSWRSGWPPSRCGPRSARPTAPSTSWSGALRWSSARTRRSPRWRGR